MKTVHPLGKINKQSNPKTSAIQIQNKLEKTQHKKTFDKTLLFPKDKKDV